MGGLNLHETDSPVDYHLLTIKTVSSRLLSLGYKESNGYRGEYWPSRL